MNSWKIRIGINPISWCNDDLPALGGETSIDTVLSEGSAIGYQGFELGNKFPDDSAALKEKLAQYDVVCVSGWYSGHLAEGSVESEIEQCNSHMKKLQEQGCNVVVYGEVSGSIQGRVDIPLTKRPQFTSDDQWKTYARKLNAFAEHLQAAYSITLAYHHHMGAYVESPADVDRLMAETDESVGLLFDTGHAFFGGELNPLELLNRHFKRVVHVHCKDVRPQVIKAARNEGWSFLDSVINGAFTVPGDGAIDFESILEALRDGGYEGWLVVEAEQDPAVAPSLDYATKGFGFLSGAIERLNASSHETRTT